MGQKKISEVSKRGLYLSLHHVWNKSLVLDTLCTRSERVVGILSSPYSFYKDYRLPFFMSSILYLKRHYTFYTLTSTNALSSSINCLTDHPTLRLSGFENGQKRSSPNNTSAKEKE